MTILVIKTNTHIYTTAHKTILFKEVVNGPIYSYISVMDKAKAIAFNKACESVKPQCAYVELFTAKNDMDIFNYLDKNI